MTPYTSSFFSSSGQQLLMMRERLAIEEAGRALIVALVDRCQEKNVSIEIVAAGDSPPQGWKDYQLFPLPLLAILSLKKKLHVDSREPSAQIAASELLMGVK